jgi:hypothetical protein
MRVYSRVEQMTNNTLITRPPPAGGAPCLPVTKVRGFTARSGNTDGLSGGTSLIIYAILGNVQYKDNLVMESTLSGG